MVRAVALSTTELSPRRLTRRVTVAAFAVWLGSVPLRALAQPVPYLRDRSPRRLPLKAFRGEPAISGFGWHFTSTHSSSLSFEPLMGSGLQHALPRLHPGHG